MKWGLVHLSLRCLTMVSKIGWLSRSCFSRWMSSSDLEGDKMVDYYWKHVSHFPNLHCPIKPSSERVSSSPAVDLWSECCPWPRKTEVPSASPRFGCWRHADGLSVSGTSRLRRTFKDPARRRYLCLFSSYSSNSSGRQHVSMSRAKLMHPRNPPAPIIILHTQNDPRMINSNGSESKLRTLQKKNKKNF